MIIYSSSKKDFINDVNNKIIQEILNNKIKEKLYHYTSESERSSWNHSLEYMSKIISMSKLPEDCTIVLE